MDLRFRSKRSGRWVIVVAMWDTFAGAGNKNFPARHDSIRLAKVQQTFRLRSSFVDVPILGHCYNENHMPSLQSYLFFLLTFTFIGCADTDPSDTTSTESEPAERMADFAKNKEFRDQHELPVPLDTFLGTGAMITFPVPGGEPGGAYLVNSQATTDRYLFVVHEWYGLNDHIKQEAERWQESLGDIKVMALDLYDGQVADSRERAQELMSSREDERLEAIIKGAIAYASPDAVIGTIGWCFGGGWSLRSAILAGEQAEACVMYYGMPVKTADAIAPLEAPVLGLFAAQEEWIDKEVVGEFENLAQATGKDLTVEFFDADHAFANPSSPRYNEEAAQRANKMALDFLQKNLMGM